jgi:tetratricopeptide (TPR) repeat protein
MSDEDRLAIYTDSAVVHYEQGDLDRAQAQALRGLAIDKNHRPLNLMLAWILLRRDKTDTLLRAEQIFRRQESAESDDRAQLGLAMTLERLGALNAEAADAVASGRTPTDASSIEEGVEDLREEARDKRLEALALFESILELRPNNLKARNGAMRVSAELERFDASLAHCARLIESVEGDRSFWTRQLQTQDISPSDEVILRERVKAHAALLVDAHLFAASVLHDVGRPAEALPHLDAVVRLDPTVSEAYSQRAQVLAGEGRLGEAVEDLDRFIARSEKPFEHPDIRRAFALRSEWARSLQGR